MHITVWSVRTEEKYPERKPKNLPLASFPERSWEDTSENALCYLIVALLTAFFFIQH